MKLKKIIENIFDEEIFASSSETVLGVESHIDGKEQFIERLCEELKPFLKEQACTCSGTRERYSGVFFRCDKCGKFHQTPR